jgi:hypothetical protein
MKKYLLVTVLSITANCSILLAQKLAATNTPPAINATNSVEVNAKAVEVLQFKENEFDFGKIPQGKPVTHKFEVTNAGTDSLKITNVQASCGCTTPDWEREKVQAPGEKTTITVGFNAASEGPFNKVITISYNGSLSKQITIRGEVWKTPVSSAPENKTLNQLKEK